MDRKYIRLCHVWSVFPKVLFSCHGHNFEQLCHHIPALLWLGTLLHIPCINFGKSPGSSCYGGTASPSRFVLQSELIISVFGCPIFTLMLSILYRYTAMALIQGFTLLTYFVISSNENQSVCNILKCYDIGNADDVLWCCLWQWVIYDVSIVKDNYQC